MRKIKSIVVLIFLGIGVCFGSEEACDTQLIPYKKHFVSLLSENDAYVNQYVDRYYTAGTRLSFTTEEMNFNCEDRDSKMAWAGYITLGWSKNKMTRFDISLNQDIYTPYSRVSHPISDHPYGAYLRLNFGVSHRSESLLENIFLALGMVGPSALGYETQKLIHYLTNNPKFYGWSHQLKNEFILNLNYQVIKKIYLWDSKYISSDILPSFDIALGNADTHVSIGTRLRIGYNLDSDFGVNKINSGFSGGEPYNNQFSFYVFGGISGKYQARNIFIQGNSFGKSTGLDMNYLAYDGEAGVAILYQGMRFAYTYTHTSKTFKSQPKAHDFGSIELNIAF
ncbi:lipid A deacylase LpxR family protein [Helicobacter sp. 11S03491-1]|uniref:lipid A deacylase LpxR family protein n=1 Tax=Helicobacter sp. 11S03491-1 TaxID=1476196 RepID=UPI000BA636B8|nr:lipid A deacylase LpxR family protein [Helicobacter sp. 11S03491-1]PAF42246.1 hypothetical protein BKH45_04695 [Helicobacter sp. 11S03491-1]